MPQQSGLTFILFQVLPLILIFYFLVLRPQQQQQKKAKQMRENLKKNDQVITSSGIYGTVVIIKDKTVVLRIDDGARIEILKEHIDSLVNTNEVKPEVVK